MENGVTGDTGPGECGDNELVVRGGVEVAEVENKV